MSYFKGTFPCGFFDNNGIEWDKKTKKRNNMLKENITPQNVVNFLNELLVTDKEAITKLFFHSEQINEELALHPTVQCSVKNKEYFLRFIGILNGLFGTNEAIYGCLAMEVDGQNIKEFIYNPKLGIDKK